MRDCVARTKLAWEGDPPAWILALAEQCEGTSFGQVAEELGVSKALISLGLRNRHHAPLGYLQRRVAERMAASIPCPVLGNITPLRCVEERGKPFCSASPLRIQLFRACRACKQNETL